MPALDFGEARRPRRPSLTPLVDVVFLLLVFFMLAARFTVDRSIALTPPQPGEAEAGYEGAPRIVTVSAAGLKLNGTPVTLDGLPDALAPLMPWPDAAIVLQSAEDASVQEIVIVLDRLAAAGLTSLVIAE